MKFNYEKDVVYCAFAIIWEEGKKLGKTNNQEDFRNN